MILFLFAFPRKYCPVKTLSRKWHNNAFPTMTICSTKHKKLDIELESIIQIEHYTYLHLMWCHLAILVSAWLAYEQTEPGHSWKKNYLSSLLTDSKYPRFLIKQRNLLIKVFELVMFELYVKIRQKYFYHKLINLIILTRGPMMLTIIWSLFQFCAECRLNERVVEMNKININ